MTSRTADAMKDHEEFRGLAAQDGTFLAKAIWNILLILQKLWRKTVTAATARLAGNGGQCSKTNSDTLLAIEFKCSSAIGALSRLRSKLQATGERTTQACGDGDG